MGKSDVIICEVTVGKGQKLRKAAMVVLVVLPSIASLILGINLVHTMERQADVTQEVFALRAALAQERGARLQMQIEHAEDELIWADILMRRTGQIDPKLYANADDTPKPTIRRQPRTARRTPSRHRPVSDHGCGPDSGPLCGLERP